MISNDLTQADAVENYEWKSTEPKKSGEEKPADTHKCDFELGAKVKLVKRITCEFKASSNHRKDFNVGHETFVVDSNKGWLVLEFGCELNGTSITQKKKD